MQTANRVSHNEQGKARLQMLKLINDTRSKAGRSPLRLNADTSAQRHAEHMAETRTFYHAAPSENICEDTLHNARPTAMVNRAHKALMNSRGHADNILNPKSQSVSLGFARDRNNRFVVVQRFT
ncbi:MAG: CAP domain-containing protein [Chloroflexi bacterium]|nr:CAP domain-containing protein [Chloroflexota bacterium]